MRIILTVDLEIDGNRLSLNGEFHPRRSEDIPQVALNWIKKIKMDTGYRKTKINKVIWDNENDVTDRVKELENAPIKDNDPHL